MFITPAYAQTAGGDGPSLIATLIPFILIFLIMWLLIIRPQQKRMKEHRAMIEALKRGDQVVTAGGIVGRVTKLRDDGEVEVEIAPNVTVRVIKSTISNVLSKTEPATGQK